MLKQNPRCKTQQEYVGNQREQNTYFSAAFFCRKKYYFSMTREIQELYLPLFTKHIESLFPREILQNKRNNPPMKLQH